MKKLLFTLFAGSLLSVGSLTAQEGFSKGDIFVSGALGFVSEKDNNSDTKDNFFQIAPSVNYFVTENISLGAKIGFESDKSETSGTDTQDDQTFSVGVVGRYYITPADQFSLFGQLDAGINNTNDKILDTKSNGFDANLGLGINYFVSDKFSLEAGIGILGFSSEKLDVTGAESETSFGLGLNMTDLTFGLNYKL